MKLATLTQSMSVSPRQILTGLIATVLGAFLTFATAWIHNVNATQTNHESKIAVLDERSKNTEKSVDEIRATTRRIEDKLDRALEKK